MKACELCWEHAQEGETIALDEGEPIGHEATPDELAMMVRPAVLRVLEGKHRGKSLCAVCVLIAYPAGVKVERIT